MSVGADGSFVLQGTNLDAVTDLKISGGAYGTPVPLSLVTKTAKQITAAAAASLNLAVGVAYSLLVSTAAAQSTVSVTFTLPSNVVTTPSGCSDGQVLTYSAGAWTCAALPTPPVTSSFFLHPSDFSRDFGGHCVGDGVSDDGEWRVLPPSGTPGTTCDSHAENWLHLPDGAVLKSIACRLSGNFQTSSAINVYERSNWKNTPAYPLNCYPDPFSGTQAPDVPVVTSNDPSTGLAALCNAPASTTTPVIYYIDVVMVSSNSVGQGEVDLLGCEVDYTPAAAR